MKKNQKEIVVDLHTDGGVILENPSPVGGTYAWLLVEGEEIRMQGSGLLLPENTNGVVVTNNQTELYAVLKGLMAVQDKGWTLRYVYSDSKVTLSRVFQGQALNGIPDWMVTLKAELLPVLKGVQGFWIGGHKGHKWNEYCDEACRKQAEKYTLKKFGLKSRKVVKHG